MKMAVLLALDVLMVPAVAMEVGSERLFEGTVKVTLASDIGLGSTMSGRSGQVQLRELVLGHDGKGYHCLHFRRYPWGENAWRGDIVRFVVVAKDRRATDVSLLTDDFLPFLPRHLWLPTPPLRCTGQVWENKADTTVWWFAPNPLPTRYRLVGSERVNGQPCWVVERTLPPQIGAVQLKRYRERWWLAKADGATVRYALDMAMNQTLPLGGVYSLELQLELQLRQKTRLPKEALVKLQAAQQRLASWQRRWTQVRQTPPESEEALKALEGLLSEWEAWRKEETDEWLVQCALMPLGSQLVEMRRRLTEARAQKGVLTPAPDFALKDTDGVTHRLSELRGNFVVLSFFGLG